MKQFLLILLFVGSLSCFSQEKKVFYYRGTGTDTLILKENSFKLIGSVGIAKSIIDEGIFSMRGDTLLLKRLTKTLINNLDTVDNTRIVDTFLILDNETMAFVNDNHYDLYKLIRLYNRNKLIRETKYSYVDTLIRNININGTFYKGIHLNSYPVKNEIESFYDMDGVIIKQCNWINGKLLSPCSEKK